MPADTTGARAACWSSRRRASSPSRSKTKSTASRTTRPITSAAVYGGVEMGGQERALRAGVDIIVATPGRLIDHMRQQNADLSAVELLVLDEADRMMDMGFWPDVRRIIAALPASRQTLLFSATMPDDVVRSAFEIVRDPKFVQVGQRSAPAQNDHASRARRAVGPEDRLADRAPRRPEGPVLLFSRTKIGADRLARKLAAAGVKCIALHSDRTMDQRRQAVEGFRGGQIQRAGRDRHRRARPRHRRHPHRHQLRSARFARHLRAPRGPDGTSRTKSARPLRSSRRKSSARSPR